MFNIQQHKSKKITIYGSITLTVTAPIDFIRAHRLTSGTTT